MIIRLYCEDAGAVKQSWVPLTLNTHTLLYPVISCCLLEFIDVTFRLVHWLDWIGLALTNSSSLQRNVSTAPFKIRTSDKYDIREYIFISFCRRFRPKWLTVFHTFTHWWRWLPCEVLTSTSGAVWGSVSWSRMLRHAGRGNLTSNLLITGSWLYPWATTT